MVKIFLILLLSTVQYKSYIPKVNDFVSIRPEFFIGHPETIPQLASSTDHDSERSSSRLLCRERDICICILLLVNLCALNDLSACKIFLECSQNLLVVLLRMERVEREVDNRIDAAADNRHSEERTAAMGGVITIHADI